MSYSRNCPDCGKELTYTDLGNRNYAEKRKTKCYQCSQKNSLGKNYDYASHYDAALDKYFYTCHMCQEHIYVACKRGLRRAIVRGNPCNACKYYNPKSKFQDPKSIEAKADRCRKLLKDFDLTGKNNPTYKAENRKKSSERIKKMRNDPNSLMSKSLRTDECSRKLSEANKKKWQDPNCKFNSPEFRTKLLARIKKDLLPNVNVGQRVSKGEIRFYKRIEKLGFNHNTDCKILIDKYYPDYVHNQHKLIVEFNGDRYHANPNLDKYKDDNTIVDLPGGRKKTAKEIRDYDRQRIATIENCGYKVFIVWEHDTLSIARLNKVINDLSSIVDNLNKSELLQ